MCLQIESAFSIPNATVRITRAAFPKGKPYMKMQDILGALFEDKPFAKLFLPRYMSVSPAACVR